MQPNYERRSVMFNSDKASLSRALGLLLLVSSPLWLGYLVLSGLLLLGAAGSGWWLPALAVLVVLGVILVRVLRACILKVPFSYAQLAEARLSQQPVIFLGGYHFCLPGVYTWRDQVPTW